MIEAGVVVDLEGQPLHWHLPPGRSGGALPDSRDLWDVIWTNRERISGIAHSHPGQGVPGPSFEDVTTFSAIELALGRRLDWWITSADRVALVRWRGPAKYDYDAEPLESEPSWVAELRRLSK
jgi:hypothetical protein